MVKQTNFRIISATAMLLLMSSMVCADVTARVDRSDIELNESFTLELTTDSNLDMRPDVSVLETDFYVGQGNQMSNTQIINGQISRSRSWTFVLMPKRAGEITIPAIAIGNERSQSVTINVKEPTYSPPGEADVFITSEVDFDSTYVQAQVLLTIKIYRAVATRQPALREPVVSGVEVLTELAGEDRNYEAVIDNRSYAVLERVYALFPQESGTIEISPARFEARVLRDGRITGRKVYESEAASVTVEPTPPPPADYPDAAWLPARDVKIAEDWSREIDEIKAGEPLTRKVTISALGQLETQIPALEVPAPDSINVYPDKPELSRNIESGGIRGTRRDQYAMIGVTAGDVVLPALEVPWWSLDDAEWKVARLPERRIEILPTAEAAVPVATAPAVEPGPQAQSLPEAPVLFGQGVWQRIAQLLGALWIVTLFLWWWTTRKPKTPHAAPTAVPQHKQQSRRLKEARKAASSNDLSSLKTHLLAWAAVQWPQDPPLSLGAMSERVAAPLAEQLAQLSRASYGPAGGDWDRAALAAALRSVKVREDSQSNDGELLPPLMPTG